MNEWLVYQNNGTRNLPLSPELINAMRFVPELGLQMRVFSGGQPGIGSGQPRVGSTRHDHGGAGDVEFWQGDRRIDWNNPNDMSLINEIITRAKANGVAGIGAGDDYMGAGRFHMGFGAPAYWGADGKTENAPGWLVDMYTGAPLGTTPTASTTANYAASTPSTLGMLGAAAPGEFDMGTPVVASGLADMYANQAQKPVQDYQAKIESRKEEERRRKEALFGSPLVGMFG